MLLCSSLPPYNCHSLSVWQRLAAMFPVLYRFLCVAITRPALSCPPTSPSVPHIYACCFAAVTEAHILIAARWGRPTAHTQTHTHHPLGTHTHRQHMGNPTHAECDCGKWCCIQMAFPRWESQAAVCFCVFLLPTGLKFFFFQVFNGIFCCNIWPKCV